MAQLSGSRAVADFDSASAMLRATAAALHGRTFPRLGQGRLAGAAVRASAALPLPLRRAAYARVSGAEAVPSDRLGDLDTEAVARWTVGQYPERRYPAVALGASNGAAVHLWAALGVPWLPQTWLLPVRARTDLDDPRRAMETGVRLAGPLLDAAPDLALHHMHDPNHDRLTLQRMAYFRVKRRRLGATYTRFLSDCLAPGGTVVVVDDRSRWPVTRIGERHVFQFGAQGGATVEEYFSGGPRVAAFLREQGAGRSRWDPPEPDDDAPEAEWGLDPSLLDDVQRWAAEHGHPVRRIVLDAPEDLSPVVADLHREWYLARGLPAERLLVESFVLVDPVAALRSGSVPFWSLFPVGPSVDRLAAYLHRATYDEVLALLFPHGTSSIGVAPPAQWQSALSTARRSGRLLSVDPARFPADFGHLARYGSALQRLGPLRPLPEEPLTLADLDRLVPGLLTVPDGQR
ncbi:MAG: hypothetical protein AVDCRST_MAG16-2043 [uncultured Frankineae bacterium]|uniref:Uncharacterized protein n=1 Tax=uncultured Frankineae bacterium TaxID=437475 RepID=A0A6J4M0H6_9ACTN|nr:MAG: hypothetical protein AVDCRST_MAG16-2043 [uncultured Frankineae bacterium]